MKFKVGQVWKDRIGNIYQIYKIDITAVYPIRSFNRNGEEFIFSSKGYYVSWNIESERDLIELISEPEDKEMSDIKDDDGWISIHDKLPKIGREVETKYAKSDDIVKNHLWANDNSEYTWHIYSNKKLVTHWRPLKKKKPDFGKLKRGDIVIAEFHDDNKWGSTFLGIDEEKDRITLSYGIDHKISCIKKITRIDIDKQTFEEI